MFFANVEDVIPESNIICVSPHYDDFLFFIGGYVLEMKDRGLIETKRFTNINAMSRTNYQERDTVGNKDQSLKRVQYATGIRLIEDLECLDALLGPRNYRYRIMGENESQVRGKVFNEAEDEMEMAFGDYSTMDGPDWEILGRMEACIGDLAQRQDTAIVLPLSMKGHIDHFIVREGGVRAMTGAEPEATFYFAEDRPYAGLMNEEESRINDDFIAEHGLKDRAYNGHPEEILRLAYAHYPSQVDAIFDEGVMARNEQLKKLYNRDVDTDRIYKWM